MFGTGEGFDCGYGESLDYNNGSSWLLSCATVWEEDGFVLS